MTDRPIMFSAPMVRALLEGRKTQTRRVLRNPEYYGCPTGDCPHDRQAECNAAMMENALPDVRFKVGDRLWVKETLERANGEAVGYPANGDWLPNTPWRWKGDKLSSIFCPRELSRLTLIVTDVRVERLQDISEADAIAEGALCYVCGNGRLDGTSENECACFHSKSVAIPSYQVLWNSINGPGAWDENPWVVAVSFDVVHRNIATPTPGSAS